mgnify:CR=1 FL=1
MAKRRSDTPPALSDAEWKVMRALWARHPATARELLDALAADTGWAYTTLRTLLARLVEKGAVSESKEESFRFVFGIEVRSDFVGVQHL